MQLVKLEIKREMWGESKDQFKGVIKFDNELGEVGMVLTHEKCDELFKICADGLVETAKAAAAELTCNVMEHQKSLSNKR